MELAPVVSIIITAIVLLLQIISLVTIAGLKKSIDELKEAKPAPAPVPSNDRFQKPNGDIRRHERRPFSEGRPRQQQQQSQSPAPAAVAPIVAADPVEKSLRDINLKLKNVERDQESVRKSSPEGFGNQSRDRDNRGDRDRNRDDRDNRGNRDREGGRDRGGRDRGRERGRDGGRDRGGRDRGRDNWQDRNRQNPSQTQQAPSAFASGDEVVLEQTTFSTPVDMATPVQQYTPRETVAAPIEPTVQSQESNEIGSTDSENLQHGRKIFVKRRELTSDAETSGSESNVSSTLASNPEEETTFASAPGMDKDIQFGRRKG